jgi:serine/threonine protein kinase
MQEDFFLARKVIKCGPRLKLEDAINEVEHLQRLRHSHIIQLVGSYTKGRTFAILMYPVADLDLSKFMGHVEEILASGVSGMKEYMAAISLGHFFECLASAVSYIHGQKTKHMDIMPQNILVKQHPKYLLNHHVYIADFGISRHFSALDHSQTDGLTAFTPKYCAPEVYDEDVRGRSADVFSLGCVFLEMHTVLCYRTLEEFVEYRSKDSHNESFHANLDKVIGWADRLSIVNPFYVVRQHVWDKEVVSQKTLRNQNFIRLIKRMLSAKAVERPSGIEIFHELTADVWKC